MLCIATAGAIMALATTTFTLDWTHSVEHTQWRESWRIENARLHLVSASVQGSGAGIAVPDDAVWANGVWTYQPELAPVASLNLAASGATVSPWTLCSQQGECLDLGEKAGDPVRLWATAAHSCEAAGDAPKQF